MSITWAATRATGVVAFVLLSATLLLGIVASAGISGRLWPRFASQDLHRNLSLLSLAFVALHVVTTVADGFVRIGYLDAVVPFHSPYRRMYTGMGSIALDLLLAVLISSALRRRIGYAAWRAVHWAAYLCWPVALTHALGTGSDARAGLVQVLYVACGLAAGGAALAWTLRRRDLRPGIRAAGAAAALFIGVAILGFATLGPLRPNWSHRAVAPEDPSTPALSPVRTTGTEFGAAA